MKNRTNTERELRRYCERHNRQVYPQVMEFLSEQSERAGLEQEAEEFHKAAEGPYLGSDVMISIVKELQKHNNHLTIAIDEDGEIAEATLRTPDGNVQQIDVERYNREKRSH